MSKRLREQMSVAPSNTLNCCFCGEDAAVTVDGNFPKAYCFLHYYTTRACRKKNVTVLAGVGSMIEGSNFQIQSLFADAFISLQEEIKEVAARYDPMDPLSLLDDCKQHNFNSKTTKEARPKKRFNDGFMPELSTMEKQLMDKNMKSSVTMEIPKPYRRKTLPDSTICIKAMDRPDDKTYSIESDPHKNVCCCGSSNVISDGNIHPRNEEGSKAEIWGSKQDNDWTGRFRCLNCGRTSYL